MFVNFSSNLRKTPISFSQLPPSPLSHFNTCSLPSQYSLHQNQLETLKWKNIARGTTDPEIDSVNWIKLGNNMAPLVDDVPDLGVMGVHDHVQPLQEETRIRKHVNKVCSL